GTSLYLRGRGQRVMCHWYAAPVTPAEPDHGPESGAPGASREVLPVALHPIGRGRACPQSRGARPGFTLATLLAPLAPMPGLRGEGPGSAFPLVSGAFVTEPPKGIEP